MQRPDDCWQRHGLEEHRGIDLGATVCLADGRLGGWPAGTPVTAPHVAARPWPIERDDARAWLVELEDEGVVLRVLLVGYHLAGGALASFDGSAGPGSWRSVDPVFRALGYPKGNHLHLEILGLHANTRRLRLFIEQRLMPALLRAPARPGSSKPVAFFRSRVPATHRPGVAVSRLLSGAARALPALPLERRGRRWRLTRPFVPGPAWHQSGARMAELRLVEGPGLQLALRLDGLGRGPTCVDFTWSNGIGLDVATCAALAEDFLIPALLARARK